MFKFASLLMPLPSSNWVGGKIGFNDDLCKRKVMKGSHSHKKEVYMLSEGGCTMHKYSGYGMVVPTFKCWRSSNNVDIINKRPKVLNVLIKLEVR